MNALPRLAPPDGPRTSPELDRSVISGASWLPSPTLTIPLPETERAWVAGIRTGDGAAFETMFRTYYQTLHAFASAYVRNGATADELVQDVFSWIWEHRATWFVDASLRTYLFGAVRNRALNHTRRQRIMERWQHQTAVDVAAHADRRCAEPADAHMVEADFAAALRRAVQRLPARCRETYLLRWAHHLSHKEIAAHMGISEKTVEFQITKALKTLRQGLADFF